MRIHAYIYKHKKWLQKRKRKTRCTVDTAYRLRSKSYSGPSRSHAPVAWMVQSGNYIMEELPDGSEVIRNTDLVVTVPRDCVRWITKPPDAMAMVMTSMDPGRARALAELRAECCRLSELE